MAHTFKIIPAKPTLIHPISVWVVKETATTI